MTINDQIRDEKLQYGINREAAKISALSSGKIDKYEYLTGEEISPSNQQQIIEQLTFTSSPLRKAFEKQIKTIEDQEQKQVEAKKTYNIILNKRLDEIHKISDKIDYNKLTYYLKNSRISPINFIRFRSPLHIFNEMKNGNISWKKAEEEQDLLKASFGGITSGNPKHKSDSQLDTIENVKNLRDLRQKIIDLFNNNTKITSETIYKWKQNETTGIGLKTLTPKQMLQRLPIALAQVKTANNSESLLN